MMKPLLVILFGNGSLFESVWLRYPRAGRRGRHGQLPLPRAVLTGSGQKFLAATNDVLRLQFREASSQQPAGREAAMGMTIVEKIFARASGRSDDGGDLVVV